MSWRGYEDGGPHLGRRGLIWFRRRIREQVRAWLVRDGVPVQDDDGAALLGAMIDWYTERSSEFARWHENAEYRGPGFSCGFWALTPAVQGRYDEAYNAVCEDFGFDPVDVAPPLVAPPKPPHEQPIPPGPIDIEAALQALTVRPQRPPREDHAWCVLDKRDGKAASQRFDAQRKRYERRMPRVCKTCGETFTSGSPAMTCQACKAAGSKRCIKCGEVFAVKSAKEKRCLPCIEKAAKAGDVASAALLQRKREAAGGQRGRRAK